MKKKLILIIVLLMALIVIGFIFKDPKAKENEKVDLSRDELVVAGSFETKVLEENNDYVKFDVKYPYFKNTNDDFNLKIEDLIKSQMKDHASVSKDNWQARYDTQTKGDNIEKIPKTDEEKFSFFSNFEIIQSNPSYISFVLKYGGFSGGAHGYENYISFNYDIKNQKLIELKDLFPNNPEYLSYLSEKSREYLKSEFATVSEEDKKNSSPEAIQEYVDNIISMIEVGTEPKEENFSIFTFTEDKVKIYFAQYQVGPYVIGMPEVEIDRK
jgi:hypothetical protein